MKLVVIESPYAGDVERNVEYAKRCMKDSILKGEAPYASHLLYTQVLNDEVKHERREGIRAGFAWGEQASKRILYIDYGMSNGMKLGLQEANRLGQEVEIREIGKNDEDIYSEPVEDLYREIGRNE